MGTRHNLRVVGEKTEPLVRVNHQLVAVVTLESFRTARDSCEYVIGIHGAQDKMSAGPGLKAEFAYDAGSPALQAAHANWSQEA